MGKKTKLPFRLHTHRTGLIYVAFTHAGREYDLSTGTRSELESLGRARARYHQITEGQPAAEQAAAFPVLPLAKRWTGEISGKAVDVDTARFYYGYAKIWDGHFRDLHAIHDQNGAVTKYIYTRATRVLVSTVKKELAALRGFLRWCFNQGKLPAVPHIPTPDQHLKGVRANPTRKRTGTLLTRVEVARVLKAMPPFLRKRDGQPIPMRGYFETLYETGLRPVTVELLQVGRHYSPGQTELFVTEDIDKNDFERRVPLSPRARKALDAAAAGKPEGALIFGRHEYRRALIKAADKAGLRGVTEYDFKHSRATHLLEAGGDLLGTAYLLGLTQLSTVAKYAKANAAAARATLKKVDRKKGRST